jgi:hypothetical protein
MSVKTAAGTTQFSLSPHINLLHSPPKIIYHTKSASINKSVTFSVIEVAVNLAFLNLHHKSPIKTSAHKNRLWFHFLNILLNGVVAVLEVRLWFYHENRGCKHEW